MTENFLSDIFDKHDKHLIDNQFQCMRCGFCLPTCPTYALTGRERSSPRGRVALAMAVAQGRMELTPTIEHEAFFCLDCRACTTACPSGVRAGEIMELYRSKAVSARRTLDDTITGLRGFVLQKMLPNPAIMEKTMLATRLYQRLAIQWLVRRLGLLKLGPDWLERAEGMLPELSAPLRLDVPRRVSAISQTRGRVGFFMGCVMSLMFPRVSRQTIRVLSSQGFEVVIPKEIKCCGAPHMNEGDRQTAIKLADHNVRVMMDAEVDFVVTDCAACGAVLKEYEELAGQKQKLLFHDFQQKVRDISEFLVEVGIDTTLFKSIQQKVTYHEPCHLCHAQRVIKQPRYIMNQIPGIEFCELNEANWCCGSAATWGLKFAQESNQILQRKLDNIEKTEADTVVTANPGCHLQLAWGLKKRGMKQKVIHLMELLGEAHE